MDCTTDEMAILCGEGMYGSLLPCHMEWLSQKTTEQSLDSLCICIPMVSENLVLDIRGKSAIKRVVFVINVGKSQDGSVFIISSHHPRNQSNQHWVLAVVEDQMVFYFDTFGWNVPSTLLEKLSLFMQPLDLPFSKEAQIVQMHIPSSSGLVHSCSDACRNYPRQSCCDDCGIFVGISTVMAVLDYGVFKFFIEPGSSSNKLFLHNPSKYERYLRRLIISWFIKGEINLETLQKSYFNLETQKMVGANVIKFSIRRISNEESDMTEKAQHRDLENVSQMQLSALNEKIQQKNFRNVPQSLISVMKEKTEQNNLKNAPQSLLSVILINEKTHQETLRNPSQSLLSNTIGLEGTEFTEATDQPNTTSTKSNHQGKKPLPRRKCPYCSRDFASRNSFCVHKSSKHKEEAEKEDKPQSMQYSYCEVCKDFKTPKIQDLIKHYSDIHKKDIKVSTKLFSNEGEFNQWKKEREIESFSSFCQRGGTKLRFNGQIKVKYLFCNRTGNKLILPNRKRAQRSSTCKIDNKCTAFMTVRINKTNGSVTVDYCLHHIGHSLRLGNIVKKLLPEIRVNTTQQDIPERAEAELCDDEETGRAFNFNDSKTIESESSDIVTSASKTKPENDPNAIEKLRAGFANDVTKVLDFGLECKNIECLKLMSSKLKQMLALVKGMKGGSSVSDFPSNKNNEIQNGL